MILDKGRMACPPRLFSSFVSLPESSINPRPFFFSWFSHENCHERRCHERRGPERGRHTQSHHQGPAIRHTVRRSPFSLRRIVLIVDRVPRLDPIASSVQPSALLSTCKQALP